MADAENPPAGPTPPSDVRPVSITDEMKRSYLDYAMSVIVSRALPDVRDGLKPVHRRILYSMHEQGHTPDKKYVKSARVVGDVMGKYHPHGDTAIYDALVRMAQDFSMRLMLIDGQGNFGSVDGDAPAAMRYTECRLAKPAMSILTDIDEDTVNFQDNYDGNEREPVVLPARFPNLLVNGAGGIAVGMATNIPPHNLGEVVDACIALINDPALTIDDLIKIVPGPDFPTGGIILGRAGIQSAYHTGRGSIVMRGKVEIETVRKEREAIVISEIPYQVNKATMIERMAELVREKKIEGIAELRDESDRAGLPRRDRAQARCDARRGAEPALSLHALQTSFGANMVALDGGRPLVMNLKDMLTAFIAFREEVVSRRTKFRLNKARDRAHILVGLAIAVANIDEVIKLIRASKDANEARDKLMEREWPANTAADLIALIDDPRHRVSSAGTAKLTAEQTKAILDLRLQRLTALGRDEIKDELDKLAAEISDYLDILRSRARIQSIVKEELVDGEGRVRHAAPHRDRRAGGRGRGRGPDPPRGHGGDGLASRLRQARPALDLPDAAARRQRPLRHADPRRGFRVAAVRGVHAHAGAVLLVARPGLQGEGVAPAARRSAGARQAADQHPADRAGRAHDLDPAAARGREHLGQSRRDVRDHQGHGAAKQAVGLRRRAALRHHRHEARRGRGHPRRAGLHREGRRAADHRAGPVHPLPGDRRARVLRPHLDGRARHQSRRRRPGDLAVDPGPSRRQLRGARGVSQARQCGAPRRRRGGRGCVVDAEEAAAPAIELGEQRYVEMSAAEQFILTISERGHGKRSSSYEYRITGRGGKGLVAMAIWEGKKGSETIKEKIGKLVASFPVEEADQLMLVTDGGKLIRTPVNGIRIAGRSTQGVIVFNTADDEKVMSVERIGEEGDDNGGN